MPAFRYQPDADEEEELDYNELYGRAASGDEDVDIPLYDEEAALQVEQAELDEMEDFPVQKNASAYQSGWSSIAKSSTPYGTSKIDKGKQRQQVVDLDDYEDAGVYPSYTNGHNASTSGPYVESSEIQQLTKEIASYDAQILDLQASRQDLARQRDQLQAKAQQAVKAQEQARAREEQQRQQAQKSMKSSLPTANGTSSFQAPSRLKQAAVINYNDSSRFPWQQKLQNTLKTVFGINQLRLCQEGVLNAVLDGRDVICIMPTGGGKSVCFQAPAVLSSGCTLVISPLISLMTDQVMHLREKGIEAVMITGSTEREEMKEIQRRLMLREGMSNEKCIKLCYVTPEKIVKSKTFVSLLSKMNGAGLLSRIAIDESHCCSQMGHDFRPDYKQLSLLRSYFPSVPIVALTATCGKEVLNDVIKILQLQSCTPGDASEHGKTVFLSAPLYRQNLHYSVRPKPTSQAAAIQAMADEILLKHPNSTGIIYVLSKADTVAVSKGLMEVSEGKIRTGTYHAGMDDREKEGIHKRWRKGTVRCVVATIAFGMGIDAPDVRYVFHHCMSKSMEGYYQETGRAGRDGNDSDCVLWFRPQDASRMSGLSTNSYSGLSKVYTMLQFALDYTTCRKLLFDDYFGDPAKVVAPFSESSRPDPCGHCDNCLRLSESNLTDPTLPLPVSREVTVEAWKICKIIEAMDRLNGRVTLPQACDLCRGLGKGGFQTKTKAVKEYLDLDEVCDGKLALNKEDTETLLLQMLIGNYLKEEFYETGYNTISYVVPSPTTRNSVPPSTRYLRIKNLEELDKKLNNNEVPKFEMTTLEKKSKRGGGKKGSKKKGALAEDGEEGESDSEDDEPPKKKRKAPATKAKAKKKKDGDAEEEETGDSEVPAAIGKGKGKAKAPRKNAKKATTASSSKAVKPKTKAPGLDSSDLEEDLAAEYFQDNDGEDGDAGSRDRRSEDIDEDDDDDEDEGLLMVPEWQRLRDQRASGSATSAKPRSETAGNVIDLDSD